MRYKPTMSGARTSLLALLTLCSLPLVGCATPADKVLDEVDARVVVECDCFYDSPGYGYETVAECVDDRTLSESERGCVDGLYREETQALEAHLECRLDVEQRLTECVSMLSCTDFIGLGECIGNYTEGVNDCPQPPGDVFVKFNNCFN